MEQNTDETKEPKKRKRLLGHFLGHMYYDGVAPPISPRADRRNAARVVGLLHEWKEPKNHLRDKTKQFFVPFPFINQPAEA